MTDCEFIEKIFSGTYVNPNSIQMIHSAYRLTDGHKFIFYVLTNYEEMESAKFKTKEEAEEVRKKLIEIVHNHKKV